MSEVDAASLPNLEDERNDLKFQLVVLQGSLLKHEFDFSKMLDPLLADTAPATIEINARLKRHVTRMTARLEDLDKQNQTTPSPATPRPRTEPAPPPPARAKKVHLHHPHPPLLHVNVRPNVVVGLERKLQSLVRYCQVWRVPQIRNARENSVGNAKWAFRLFTANLDAASAAPNIKHWLIHNWCVELNGHRSRKSSVPTSQVIIFHRSTCFMPHARATKVLSI